MKTNNRRVEMREPIYLGRSPVNVDNLAADKGHFRGKPDGIATAPPEVLAHKTCTSATGLPHHTAAVLLHFLPRKVPEYLCSSRPASKLGSSHPCLAPPDDDGPSDTTTKSALFFIHHIKRFCICRLKTSNMSCARLRTRNIRDHPIPTVESQEKASHRPHVSLFPSPAQSQSGHGLSSFVLLLLCRNGASACVQCLMQRPSSSS